MTYEAITDPANPFATTGLSREVRSILDLLVDAQAKGLDVVCTSTIDHPANTASGNPSRHRMPGTDGEGLGVDCRMRTRGDALHMEVFKLFVPYEKRLHELIYTYAPYNIKNGQRVAPYAKSGHKGHCHVSVDKGVFLFTKPIPSTPKEEEMARAVKGTSAPTIYIIEGTGPILSFGDPATYREVARAYGITAKPDFSEVILINQDALNILKAKLTEKFIA